MVQNIEVASVALWYWPIQTVQYLTGGLELYLLGYVTQTTTTAAPPNKTLSYREYTGEVEEYQPPIDRQVLPNPIYASADVYLPMDVAPLSADSSDVEFVNITGRAKPAYQLTSPKGYAKLYTFKGSGCPTALSECPDGFSIGFWLYLGSELANTTDILDLIELEGLLRITWTKSTFSVIVKQDDTWHAFRGTVLPPTEIWFNIGFAIQRIPKLSLDVYINAVRVPFIEVSSPAERASLRQDYFEKSLLLGGLGVNNSAAHAAVNDITIIFRALKPFECHRFVGYTRTQLSSLQDSTIYWTPDVYILRDADSQINMTKQNRLPTATPVRLCETGATGFCLASIYKSNKVDFRVNSLDPWKKSWVPVFEMKSLQYMMLGRQKSSTVSLDSLTWTGHCLHDPSESSCGAHGFTVSMWLKFYSVSMSRLRFYLNSGDPGTYSFSIQDNRGVTIFSDSTLIGVSVSQRYTDWKLILDSSIYKIGQWINIGILWSETNGLNMLVDGIRYGSSDVQGTRLFKGRTAPPYVVLGRFDTDDDTTWLPPAEANQRECQQQASCGKVAWEMAHFALGEVTYFGSLLTETEYRNHFELLGSARLREADGYLWYGAQLADPPVSYLKTAVQDNLPKPGPVLLNTSNSGVNLTNNPMAILIEGDTVLCIGPLVADDCPTNVSKCEKGLSVGAWIRLGGPHFAPTATDTTPVLLFSGSNGSFGIAMQQNGNNLGAWVYTSQQSWKCAVTKANLATETMNMQWVHIGLVWGPEEGQRNFTLRLILNGKVLQLCEADDASASDRDINLTAASKLPSTAWVKEAAETAKALHSIIVSASDRYILMSSQNLYEIGSKLSVAVLVIRPVTLIGSGLMNLLGVEYTQWVGLQSSTFFWTFTGILRDFAPSRATAYKVQYEMDKDDIPFGAWCTDGSGQSFVTLTGDLVGPQSRINLAGVCMINPKKCKDYVFTIQFKLLQIASQVNQTMLELFRSTPMDSPDNTVGLSIFIQPQEKLLIVNVRNEIQLFAESVQLKDLGSYNSWVTLDVFYSENGIRLRKNGVVITKSYESSRLLMLNDPLQSDKQAKLTFIVGRQVPMCISAVSTLDVPDGQTAESLMSIYSSSSCYPEVDYMNELKGNSRDQNDQSDSAISIKELVKPIGISNAPCLYDPTKCNSGALITSVWVRIDGFQDASGQTVDLQSVSNITTLIYTTGPPTNRGVSVHLDLIGGKDKPIMNVLLTVQTDTELWQVHSPNAIQIGEWNNIGLYFYTARGGKSGGLEFYKNGERAESSTVSRGSVDLRSENATNPELLFPQSYAVSSIKTSNLASFTPTGEISRFGECRLTVFIDIMTKAKKTNLNRMANQVGRLSDPMDYQRILQVGSDMIEASVNSNRTRTDFESDELADMLRSIVILIQSWPVALGQACDNENGSLCITIKIHWEEIIQLMITLGAQLSDWRLTEAWSLLFHLVDKVPDNVISAMSNVSKAVASALNMDETCQQEWSSTLASKNVSALVLHINFSSKCLDNNNVTLTVPDAASSKNNKIEARFTLNKNTTQSGSLVSGFLTVTKIPAPQPETIWIAGGLPVTTFTNETLAGYSGTKESSLDARHRVMSVAQSRASSLRISSSIYLVETNINLSEYRDQANEIIQFVIKLSDLNTYYDVAFYEATGRCLWKANEAEQTHLEGLGSGLPLTYPVRCVFWNSTAQSSSNLNGSWDSNGCSVTNTNLTHVECSCTHLSAFAVAKEPSDSGSRKPYWLVWGIPNQQKNDFVIRLLLLTTNGISLMGSLAFLCTLIACLVRAPIKDIYMIHCLLCVSLVLLHTSLLVQPFTAHQKVGCIATSVVLQIAGMLSTGWLFCEAVALFRCFVLGDFAVKRAWVWIFGVITPAVLMILSSALSKLAYHGQDLLCLPAHESYVFWIQFGTMFCYLFCALLVCMVIGCNIETPAYIKPVMIDKLLNRIGQLNFLIIYTAIAWSSLVIIIMIPFPYLPYLAYAAVSLQGTLLYFTLGLDDVDIINFYRGRHSGYAMDASEPKSSKSEFNGQSKIAYSTQKLTSPGYGDEDDQKSDNVAPVFDEVNEQQLDEDDDEFVPTGRVHKRGKRGKRQSRE
ncbi:hypothetical protein D915_002509 [Fasciola hepatica]|uniref:GAIN-B domain-containing protein n=1 Tax=Fasciola hepatica TaxID=6192 RepID=A0A4E0RFE3_FASHE|nr:hypothetical protein D915_002509 [Fasciola hepatica]